MEGGGGGEGSRGNKKEKEENRIIKRNISSAHAQTP